MQEEKKANKITVDTLMPLGIVVSIISSVFVLAWSMSGIKSDIARTQDNIASIKDTYIAKVENLEDDIEDIEKENEKQQKVINELKESFIKISLYFEQLPLLK